MFIFYNKIFIYERFFMIRKISICALLFASFLMKAEPDRHHHNHHDKHHGHVDFDATFQYGKDADGKPVLMKIDTKKGEIVNSATRAFGVAFVAALAASAYGQPTKTNPDGSYGLSHTFGLATAFFGNIFFGEVLMKERNLLAQVSGGLFGYILGSVVPTLIVNRSKN